jgi:hypothetical protein
LSEGGSAFCGREVVKPCKLTLFRLGNDFSGRTPEKSQAVFGVNAREFGEDTLTLQPEIGCRFTRRALPSLTALNSSQRGVKECALF